MTMTTTLCTRWQTVPTRMRQPGAALNSKRLWSASCYVCMRRTATTASTRGTRMKEALTKPKRSPRTSSSSSSQEGRSPTRRATVGGGRFGSLALSTTTARTGRRRRRRFRSWMRKMGLPRRVQRQAVRCCCSAGCARRTSSSWRARYVSCRTHQLRIVVAARGKAGRSKCGDGVGRGRVNSQFRCWAM
ncbi:hypothetical protein BJV78DRAFT_1204691, partial [Lactifluus subvellereus]